MSTPPDLDLAGLGAPALGAGAAPEGGAPPGAEASGASGAPGAGGPWTPEAMGFLLEGVFALAALARGPHWAWDPAEGDPILPHGARTFNRIPILRDLGAEWTDAMVFGLGIATLAGKRLQLDRMLVQAERERRREADAGAGAPPGPERPAEPSGSPYGPDRLRGGNP